MSKVLTVFKVWAGVLILLFIATALFRPELYLLELAFGMLGGLGFLTWTLIYLRHVESSEAAGSDDGETTEAVEAEVVEGIGNGDTVEGMEDVSAGSSVGNSDGSPLPVTGDRESTPDQDGIDHRYTNSCSGDR